MVTIYNKTYRWIGALTTILNAKGATGAGTAIDISQFNHVLVEISSDGGGNADLTVKAQGALNDTEPTWTNAQSRANFYEYIGMYDLEDTALINGDTGIVFSGADDYRLLTLNTDGLKWLNFRVTAWVAGNVTVKIRGFNNQ